VKFSEQRQALAEASRRLAAGGLVIGTAGNLSIRVDDLVVITPTGANLADLEAEMMPIIDFGGAVVDGDLAPTSEVHLHLDVYKATPAVAIAHAHAMASTAVACTHTELPPIHYTTLSLGGAIRVAPYATFGSQELADHVVAALEGRHAALMANHGSVAYGKDIAQACERLEHLEWLAELHSRAITIGTPRVLTDKDLENVIMAALSMNYGTTQKITTDEPHDHENSEASA
jgi:L-fuculose-phosphate aldolase